MFRKSRTFFIQCLLVGFFAAVPLFAHSGTPALDIVGDCYDLDIPDTDASGVPQGKSLCFVSKNSVTITETYGESVSLNAFWRRAHGRIYLGSGSGGDVINCVMSNLVDGKSFALDCGRPSRGFSGNWILRD